MRAAERVGDEEAVDEAGRLLAGVAVDGVEFGREKLDVFACSAKVLGEQAFIAGRADGPVVHRGWVTDGVKKQSLVALAPGCLNVAVVAEEPGA